MRVERTHILKSAEYEGREWDAARRNADALAKWANRSESAVQIAATLRLAESDPRIRVSPEAFDGDPWLLNLRNGCVDLRSGDVHEHRLEELLTKIAGAEYDSTARCPRWQRFLREVFAPHPDLVPYLQKAIGYTLTGETREECIFVLVGGGRNGKSTVIATLHQVLGEYAGIAEMDTFLGGGSAKLREDVADMRGRRFVSAQEPFINSKFAEATLKWVSGGDTLRARRLYEHAQEFQPTHKLWLAMNRVPALRADDDATWSRMRIIPFDVSFAERSDRELKAKLREEINGVLQWALRGCARWREGGLGFCPSVDSATREWRKLANKKQAAT